MNVIQSHRQPVAHAADVASGILPSRIDRDANPAGGHPLSPAGTPSDRARHLRLYGGPSLETLRDDLDTSVKLFAACAIISGFFGMIFAGEGFALGLPIMAAVLSVVGIGGLFWAASRRNRHAARIELIEEIASAAVSSAVMEAA